MHLQIQNMFPYYSGSKSRISFWSLSYEFSFEKRDGKQLKWSRLYRGASSSSSSSSAAIAIRLNARHHHFHPYPCAHHRHSRHCRWLPVRLPWLIPFSHSSPYLVPPLSRTSLYNVKVEQPPGSDYERNGEKGFRNDFHYANLWEQWKPLLAIRQKRNGLLYFFLSNYRRI